MKREPRRNRNKRSEGYVSSVTSGCSCVASKVPSSSIAPARASRESLPCGFLRGFNGTEPLHLAAQAAAENCCRFLASIGVDVNATDARVSYDD